MHEKNWPTLSVQTFTLRQLLKRPAQVLPVFQSLVDNGIRGVELAYIPWNDEMVQVVKDACQKTGVQVLTSQITFAKLDKQFAKMVDWHRQLNCQVATVSVLPDGVLRKGVNGWQQFAKALNALGQRYQNAGIRLLYHHHDYEFLSIDRRRCLDVILAQCEPQNVGLVIDVYWAQRSGVNPAAFIRDYSRHVEAIHLRDFKVIPGLAGMKISDCELGAGNLNITEVIHASRDANVKAMAFEQNSKTPIASIQQSVAYLNEIGFGHLLESV